MIEDVISALNKKHNRNSYEAVERNEWDSVFMRTGNGDNSRLAYYYIKQGDTNVMRKELVKLYTQCFKDNFIGEELNLIIEDSIENREMIDLMFFDTKHAPEFLFFDASTNTLNYR